MRRLTYRSPRVAAHFDVDFVGGSETFRGTCVNVSKKGIRAVFTRLPPISLAGCVIMHHPHCRMTLPARVVYLQGDQVGIAFVHHSMTNQDAVDYFMGVVANK